MTQPVGNQTLGASEPASSDIVSDYTLNVRSYAPFARFGGGFEGDSRGPSMSPLVTSAMGEPRATLARADRLPDGFLLALDVSGANPLVPGAPDIVPRGRNVVPLEVAAGFPMLPVCGLKTNRTAILEVWAR